MNDTDIAFMKDAIGLAKGCFPNESSIPKVGAVIAVDDLAIGRGRRGPGGLDDDHHAEWHALHAVKDHSRLPMATLYTTLEPCTREVRSKPLECCTELILQHRIAKVYVGILDPNQGVTGKGLYQLQAQGIEVALFPHDLAQEIRAINAGFIRTQQTFGARIISPLPNAALETFLTGGRHPVCFTCLNPPTSDHHLFVTRDGLFWPQAGPFRRGKGDTWEIDAGFGTTGSHTLLLVTATDLGNALIRYYKRVVRTNKDRRERLKAKLVAADLPLLGGDFLGIEMNGLPKGLAIEASVDVDVVSAPV